MTIIEQNLVPKNPAKKSEDGYVDNTSKPYLKELVLDHTSGRLKVAPEHTQDNVLYYMAKPSFRLFERLRTEFDKINREENMRQQLIPYFISSHPGCREEHMAELAVLTKRMDFHLEQVQDFTPTPMTIATEMWYTGYDPYTLEPVFSAKTPREKEAQRQYFFWYKDNKHDNNRTKPRPEKSREEKRGRICGQHLEALP